MDRDWWKGQIPKLHSFYFDALLPEAIKEQAGSYPMPSIVSHL